MFAVTTFFATMPEVSRLLFPSLLTAAILATVTCYPSGAPGRDCWSERPLHGDYMPAHGDSPYEIMLAKVDPKKDPDTYTPGEFISGAPRVCVYVCKCVCVWLR